MDANILKVRGLCVSYATQEALRGVSLEAGPGDFVAVLGPNGSGKSSLIKAVAGILRSWEGAIEIDGVSKPSMPPTAIGYVPQVKTMERRFPATAVELVVSGSRGRWPFRVRRAERANAFEALDSVGGAHLADRQLASLSGGELQRVYLARSLSRRPRLILLDEPATGMDVAGTSDLYAVLDEYQQTERAAVIMVTHDWNVAVHHATHVLLLNKVQVSFGRSSDVLTEANLRRTFGHVGHEHAMMEAGHGHD